jgi:hypothetical protein
MELMSVRQNVAKVVCLTILVCIPHVVQARLVNTPLHKNVKQFSLYYRELKAVERFHAYCLADLTYFSDGNSENCVRSKNAINETGQALQMGTLPPNDIDVLRQVISELLSDTEQRK